MPEAEPFAWDDLAAAVDFPEGFAPVAGFAARAGFCAVAAEARLSFFFGAGATLGARPSVFAFFADLFGAAFFPAEDFDDLALATGLDGADGLLGLPFALRAGGLAFARGCVLAFPPEDPFGRAFAVFAAFVAFLANAPPLRGRVR